MTKRFSVPVSILLLGLTVARAGAQDPISAARDLYAAAAYEDALSMLNRLLAEQARVEDRPRIEQYRAFCLLALGRGADAERAIEALVAAQPSYYPTEAEASPRVRSAFSDVRRRVLPVMIQQRYAAAKQAYDLKAYAEAEAGFREVLDVLAVPDVAPVANQSPLSDIRTLATGFHQLAVVAATPPPPPPAPPEPAPAPVAAPVPGPPRVYTTADADVAAPVALRQTLPSFPKAAQSYLMPAGGVLEVVIREDGTVERAMMRSAISPIYDQMVIAATKEWRFQPATRLGVPVKYRKMIQIAIER